MPSILPNGRTTFHDQNGAPLAGGAVYFYYPGTENFKPTFQDSAASTSNANPVLLDSLGSATIWGTGAYRQVVCDAAGTQIWDQATQDYGIALAADYYEDTFVANGSGQYSFVPGTTTAITLSRSYGSVNNIDVHFDAAYQGPDQIASLSGTTLTFAAPIPAGTQNVYVKGGLTTPITVPAASTVTDGSLASGNKVYNRAKFAVDPRDFGAKGDGVTDDTAAIMVADTWARSQTPPWRVQFSSGTYMATQLVISTNSNWRGHGKSTILRQIAGTNKDFIYGTNSSSNWGKAGSAATGFPYNFTLRDLTIDGNWNAGAGNTAGSGYAVYGDHCLIENVFIQNCAEHGMRTEFQGDSAVNYGNAFLESTFKSIWIDTVGKHGWWDNGPHDSHHIDIHVLDAGQLTDSTYDGFFFDTYSSARHVSIHPATRSGSLRMRYSVNCGPGSTGEICAGSNIEGGGVANLGLFSSGWQFDPSTRFYAAWNGTNILLGGTNCSLNKLRGKLEGPPAGRPACVGIQFSTTSGDSVHNNDIEVMMVTQDGGNVAFTAQDAGQNRIHIFHYNAANVNLFGTPNPTNDIVTRGSVPGSTVEVTTLDQIYSPLVPANGTYTITFTYPFYKQPVVTATPIGAPASSIQVTSRSPTTVVLTNTTAGNVVADVRARASF